MSDIFREVEEDLRQERAKALWRRFGPYFLALCLAVVAATGGRVLWRDWQESERLEASAAYEAAAAQARTGELALAAGRFRELAQDTGTGYAVLARLQAAASLAATDALNDAVALYDAIAADDGNPELLRDLARLYAGMLLVDRGGADEARRRLEPLALPGNDWRGLAREQPRPVVGRGRRGSRGSRRGSRRGSLNRACPCLSRGIALLEQTDRVFANNDGIVHHNPQSHDEGY